MARHRRRFYVAYPNGPGPRQVLALKHTPSPDVFSFSHRAIVGPFRTFQAAQTFAADPVYGLPRSVKGLSIRDYEKWTAERRTAA
jgi:hypothetical protein